MEAGGDPYRLVAGARLLTGVYLVLAREVIDCSGGDCAQKVMEAARRVDWRDHLSWGESFAVRSERVGDFPLTSPELASIVGRVVEERVDGVRVHLNSPGKVVVAEVDWGRLVLGIQLAGDVGLHRRWYRVREHMASLKPTLASAMIRLSGVADGQHLLDPLCGSGTIPIEALLTFEWLRATCSDKSLRSLESARVNALAAGVWRRITLLRSDVSSVGGKLGGLVDHIVTNPPYGLRVGNPRVALRVLEKTFQTASEVLDAGGRLTLLFPRAEKVEALADSLGFSIAHRRRVRHGDLDLWLMVLEKG